MGVTVVPGFAFKGFPLVSKLVVFDDGTQSVKPPLNGMDAAAPIEYSTSPGDGEAYVIFPEEKTPTLGLLAGSIKMY